MEGEDCLALGFGYILLLPKSVWGKGEGGNEGKVMQEECWMEGAGIAQVR